jgi:hypothetical protein
MYKYIHIIKMTPKTFSKSELIRLNSSSQYGFGWIKNLEKVTCNTLKLYPTGDWNMSAGRLYIALPANKAITDDDIMRYNILPGFKSDTLSSV